MLQLNNALQSGRAGSSLKTFNLKAPLQRLRKNDEGVSKHFSQHAGTIRFVEIDVMLTLVQKIMDNLGHDASADQLVGKLTWLEPSNVQEYLVSPKTAWQVQPWMSSGTKQAGGSLLSEAAEDAA